MIVKNLNLQPYRRKGHEKAILKEGDRKVAANILGDLAFFCDLLPLGKNVFKTKNSRK